MRSSPLFVRNCKNSGKSLCHTSRYTATAPALTPSWSTATAVSLMTRIQRITPPDAPSKPRIDPPRERTFPKYIPIPPPNLLTSAKLEME